MAHFLVLPQQKCGLGMAGIQFKLSLLLSFVSESNFMGNGG